MSQFVTDLLGKRVKATKIDGSSWTLNVGSVCPNDVTGFIRLITPDLVFLVEDDDHFLHIILKGSHTIQVLL